MGKSNRDIVCGVRMAIAQEVLGLVVVDVNTKKLRQACRLEFEAAAAHGTLGPMLHAVLSALAVHLRGDIQNLEGINSTIKTIGNRCSRISLALLSARVQLKYQYGAVRRTMEKDDRRQALRPIAVKLHQRMMAAYGTARRDVSSIEDRFDVPNSYANLPTLQEFKDSWAEVRPDLVLTPALRWAAVFSAIFHRFCSIATVSKCVCFGKLAESNPVFFSQTQTAGCRTFGCVLFIDEALEIGACGFLFLVALKSSAIWLRNTTTSSMLIAQRMPLAEWR